MKKLPKKPLVDTGPSLKDIWKKATKPLPGYPDWPELDESPPFEGTAMLKLDSSGDMYAKASKLSALVQEEYLKNLARETYYAPKPVESASPTCDLGVGVTISLGFRVISATIQGPYFGLRYGPAHGYMLRVTFETPCRDTGTLLTLDFHETFPDGFPMEDKGKVSTFVKNALRILCMHEVCEGIKVDGIRIFDPHLYPEAVK